ncbi:DUF401 family protein [Candidatus Fermentibacteria bacterium]|nr:DUF401 family protein [Candidatus Fermentibacteria bacterium]
MIIRVGALFLLLIILARASRGTMWLAFVGTALVAGPVLGMDPQASLDTLLRGALSVSTLRLVLFVDSIILLSGLMQRVGTLRRLGDAVRATLGSARGGVAVLPALVGLLPMPGGALFSAPLVDSAASGSSISPARRAVANYWFRHTWEFWWPLYPGIIAAVELSGIPWSLWTVRLLWLTPVAAVLGWVLILGKPGHGDARRDGRGFGLLLREMIPILLIPGFVLVSHTASVAIPSWHPDSTWLLLASVWLSIGYVLLRARQRPVALLNALNLRMVSMGGLIVALMAYKEIIMASGMAQALQHEFAQAHLPAIPIASAIALVGGLVTGIAVGLVGSTFPIIATILQASPLEYACAMGIAFLWGWVGMMLSPLHLCLLVTREHFRAEWSRIYALLFPLTVLTAAIGTVGLTTWGKAAAPAAPEGAPVHIAATLRTRESDRLILVGHEGTTSKLPHAQRYQRWPVYSADGARLVYLEGYRVWRLMVRFTDGNSSSVADSLLGARLWASWSSEGSLAASCVTADRGRWLLLQHEGGLAEPIPATMGARCPFWIGDTVGYFAPAGDGWRLGRVLPGIDAGEPWIDLPPFDPRQAAVSGDGASLAYVAIEREEQPPRNRLFVVHLRRHIVSEIGAADQDLSAPAWDGDDLLFLSQTGMTQSLVRLSRGETTTIVDLPQRLLGATLVPPVKLVVGSARPPQGRRFGLMVADWEGTILHHVSSKTGDYWGVAAAPTP